MRALLIINVWAGQDDEGEVVAVGTGDACIFSKNLTTDGRAVMDCHAEVIARKALMKYGILSVLRIWFSLSGRDFDSDIDCFCEVYNARV